MDLGAVRWYHVVGVVIVAAFLGAVAPQFAPGYEPPGQLAVIKLNGPIAYSSSLSDAAGISPKTVNDLTQQAVQDGADAIMYEINSGGGAVVASKEAAAVVERVDIPTVCKMQEVAASGAYWLASECDVVVADSLTITGSIGVSSAYLEFSGLLNKLGIDYVNLTAGEFKDMGSQYKNLTPAEREKFDHILSTVHQEFINEVAENRNMTVADVEEAATGEIFLGEDAARLGLIDRVGTRQTAIDAAKALTNKTEMQTRTYTPPQQFNLLSLLFSKVGEGIVHGMQSAQPGSLNAAWTH